MGGESTFELAGRNKREDNFPASLPSTIVMLFKRISDECTIAKI
jgi:hypothetical protein